MTETISPNSESDDESDAAWILTSAFIIFTMQSGFGLLESGSCTAKNEVNIMMKNAADVIFGGFSYWVIGYALSFGEEWSNGFCSWGNFFVTSNFNSSGSIYSKFFFKASFATTSTTIVSGAMAERTKLEAYIVYSFFNTLVFCFPAHWVWGENGWLYNLKVIDVAGAGPVHLVGGVTGLVATLLLKPRIGRFDNSGRMPQMGSPTNALLGLFMLWWGWLGFNCGSTFGISGVKWRLAARSAVSTICASIGGGMVAMTLSYVFKGRKFLVPVIINGILGSLVSITAFCALSHPYIGFIIGAVGGFISCTCDEIVVRLHIDDPVGVISIHMASSIWGLLSVGLFAQPDSDWGAINLDGNHFGLLWGGGFYLLGIQTLAVVSILSWSLVLSFIILIIIDRTLGLRVSPEHEELGADLVEHDIGDFLYDKRAQKLISRNASRRSSNIIHINDNNINPNEVSVIPASQTRNRQTGTGENPPGPNLHAKGRQPKSTFPEGRYNWCCLVRYFRRQKRNRQSPRVLNNNDIKSTENVLSKRIQHFEDNTTRRDSNSADFSEGNSRNLKWRSASVRVNRQTMTGSMSLGVRHPFPIRNQAVFANTDSTVGDLDEQNYANNQYISYI